MKPEPWRRHLVEQAHRSELVRRPSPGNPRRSPWPPRRQRQSRPPSDLIPIRVHPWPHCVSGARGTIYLMEKCCSGHGCTRILLCSYFVDTTVALEETDKIVAAIRAMAVD